MDLLHFRFHHHRHRHRRRRRRFLSRSSVSSLVLQKRRKKY